jgi:uncharacterized protein YjbI with pentapeptide repeats
MTAEIGSEEQSSRVLTKFVIIPTLVLAGIVVGLLVFDKIARTDWINASNKGVWDVLAVLIVPVAVGWATVFFTGEQEKIALNAEERRAQDEALQAYLDKMSELLIDKKLHKKSYDYDPERITARAQTLAVLERLEDAPQHKRTVLLFLREARLINRYDHHNPMAVCTAVDPLARRLVPWVNRVRNGIRCGGIKLPIRGWANITAYRYKEEHEVLYHAHYVGLENADLSGADLESARLISTNEKIPISLKGANLRGAKLSGAILRGAELREADLRKADLSRADLGPAKLQKADLTKARSLHNADPHKADLTDADLTDADLTDADLSGATVTEEQLATCESLEGATVFDRQKYEVWLGTPEGQDWLRKYKQDLGAAKKREGVYEDWIKTTEGKMWLKAVGEDGANSGASSQHSE